ncbi:MAG: hypothetical protein AAF928_05740 [Myxococcota bacterium]
MSSPPAGLFCFGGQPPPPDARFDVAEVVLLPAGARSALWPLLERCLAEHPDPGLDTHIERFAASHETPPARVARVLRVCRLLLREAARHGLDEDRFALDLTVLDPEGDRAIHALLLPRFVEIQAALRQELLYAALTDHGQLLTRVDWRADTMRSSQRGADLESPVVWVTLHYRRGAHRDRITLQALPDMVVALQRMCHDVLRQEPA